MKKIRAKTRDVAFGFRMGAGFAGDVNRTHPATIEPVMSSVVSPLTAYGQPVLIASDGVSVRPYTVGDTAVAAYGILIRPFPVQQSSASNFGQADFGNGVPAPGINDVLRSGYIMVKLPAGQAVVKNGPAFVWVAASSGIHVQGGLENAASGGNTVALANCTFNGPADTAGVTELMFNV